MPFKLKIRINFNSCNKVVNSIANTQKLSFLFLGITRTSKVTSFKDNNLKEIPDMEKLEHPLRHDVSLEQLAMSTLIIDILNDPVLKENMKEIIRTKYMEDEGHAMWVENLPFGEFFPFRILKNEVNEFASKKLNELNLPKKICTKAQDTLLFYTEMLIQWADYVVIVFKIDVSYLDEVYWTSIGTIDEEKIFDEYWRKNHSFTKILTKDTKKNWALEMACIYANEEVILFYRNLLIDEVSKIFKNVDWSSNENKVGNLAAIYLCFLHETVYWKGQFPFAGKIRKTCKWLKDSGNINLTAVIFNCWKDGFSKAQNFFWNLLDDNEKKNILKELATDCLHQAWFYCIKSIKDAHPYSENYHIIDRARNAKTIFFLINQMSLEDRNQFLKKNIGYLVLLFLLIWPYPKLLLRILDENWYSELCYASSRQIIYAPFKWMGYSRFYNECNIGSCESESHSCINIFHKILRKVFMIVPKSVKKEILSRDGRYYRYSDDVAENVLEDVYWYFDVTALSIIINDKDLADEREMMLEKGDWKIKYCDLESIFRFMEEVLISNEERKEYIKKFELENDLLTTDNLEIREKVLIWLSV